MAWKFNIQGETLSGSQKLKIGAHPYKIISFKPEVDPNDNSGKKQRVVLSLQGEEDYNCKVYFNVMDENEMVANIADKAIRTIVQAAGVKQLASTVGKVVVITGVEKAGKGKDADKKYVNILTATPFEAEAEEEEEEETPAPKAKGKAKDPEPEPEEEEEEEEEEPEEKPATKPKTRPW